MIRFLLVFAAFSLTPAVAAGHVYIVTPEEAAVVDRGAAVQISWDIAVNHGPPDTYDLMFSRDGGNQYEMIVSGLGSDQNDFGWTAPDVDVPNATLAIVQHGSNGYEFMHEVDFSVGVAPMADMGAGPVDMGTAPDMELVNRPDARMKVPDDGAPPPETGEEVLTRLEKRCAMSGCHAAEEPRAGLVLTRAAFGENLIDAPSTTNPGEVLVVGGDPASSELLARLRGERSLRMPPPPEDEFAPETIDAIADWIDAGAPESGPFEAAAEDADTGIDEAEPSAGGDAGTMAPATDESRGCTTAPGGAAPASGLLAMLFLLVAGRRVHRGSVTASELGSFC